MKTKRSAAKGWRADRRSKPLTIDLDPPLYEALSLSAAKEDRSIGRQIRHILRDWFKQKGIEIPLPLPVPLGRPSKAQIEQKDVSHGKPESEPK